MPVINFSYSDLCSLIGEEIPQSVLMERIPLIGADMHDAEEGADDMSVEFFPNRPDLYCVEGLARSLRSFLNIEPGMKKYTVEKTDINVTIDKSVKSLRPYFLCGAVFDVKINDDILKSLMELQEKLHLSIGRKRCKLAIGVHDLDKVTPPFTYSLDDPKNTKFIPLGKTEMMNLNEILEKHEKGREYASLLKGADKYPIIKDSKGNILSFPPIINGALTTVTTETRNIFVDVTGTDRKAVKGALDIVCTALAERGGRIGTVHMHDGKEDFISPNLAPFKRIISAKECDKFLGVDLGPKGVSESLRRMGLDASPEKGNKDAVSVLIPSTRVDIMHDVDVYEDVAAGYGFEKFGGLYELDNTVASRLNETIFSDGIRNIMIGLGYTEVTTLTLSNENDEFVKSGIPEEVAIKIKNPITEDHTCLRVNLFPSLMRILRHNRHRDLPQKIFEVGYVVHDGKNSLHLCAVSAASKTSFTESKSLAESILREIDCDYSIENCGYDTFVPGRGASIIADEKISGIFGEVSPKVITDFEINHPIMMIELKLDNFVLKSSSMF
ncbi:MAG TPA: phenylalanine--tRNA ligase subunit beta [Candidatus Methanomethylophilaceae archaeon]|nr:phenylalanine--tRNA ligase subunit beta [Candidatus Methanomethylophilaceae archaeon]